MKRCQFIICLIVMCLLHTPLVSAEGDQGLADKGIQRAITALKQGDDLGQLDALRVLMGFVEKQKLDLAEAFGKENTEKDAAVSLLSRIAEDGDSNLPKRDKKVSDEVLLERKFLSLLLLGRLDLERAENLLEAWSSSDHPKVKAFASQIRTDMKKAEHTIVLNDLSSQEAMAVLKILARNSNAELRNAAVINACAMIETDRSLQEEVFVLLTDIRRREKEATVRRALVENVVNLGIDDLMVNDFVQAIADDNKYQDKARQIAIDILKLSKSD